jgi:hypothetical protein
MSYPTDFESVPLVSDGSDQTIFAAHHNSIRTALNGLRTVLGDAPQGNLASVEARLDVLINDDGKLKPQTGVRFVGKSGCQYSTIQSAIDAASASDVIVIYPGTFTETVTVSKSLYFYAVGGDNIYGQGAKISGTTTINVSAYFVGLDFGGNITDALDGDSAYFFNCVQSSGTISVADGTYECWRCRFQGAISVAAEKSLSARYCLLGAITIGSDASVELYYCRCGNIGAGPKVVLWCYCGAVTVDGDTKISFCRVQSFSGTGGSGSYNIDYAHAPISVP